MKKWLLAGLTIVVAAITCIYIFIPGRLRISHIALISCPKNAANRLLLDESKWALWWPQKQPPGIGKAFMYQGDSYLVTRFFTDKILIQAITGRQTVPTAIHILPMNRDSIQLTWACELDAGWNPLSRIRQYKTATAIKSNMTAIFSHLQTFLESTSNLYGFPIKEIISKDSALVTIRSVSAGYPGNQAIYRLIDTLKNYVKSQGAFETNHPMLRISHKSAGAYQVMVAIPTNRILPGNSLIINQHFVPWKTLLGTVTGGRLMIDSAFRQMDKYVEDHQRTSMAVPFESLITNRVEQPDSLRWVTIICQPVS